MYRMIYFNFFKLISRKSYILENNDKNYRKMLHYPGLTI